MNKSEIFPEVKATIHQLIQEFDQIPKDRQELLEGLAHFIKKKITAGQTAELNFICTHNSRRSHLSQIWAQTAAAYYGISNVICYSGGTEATAFNPRAVAAMVSAGFVITKTTEGINPVYEVLFSSDENPVTAFSKKYDADVNPKTSFGAVMTCSHADQNCPIVMGASERFPITYDDPKDFDDTPLESAKYSERVIQIGREMLFTFSRIGVTN